MLWLEPYLSRKETDVFPESSWTDQRRKYDKYLNYWTGKIFQTLAQNIQVEGGKKPLRWPVKINLIKLLALMHAMALWGEWEDEIMSFRFKPKDIEEPLKTGAKTKEQAVKDIALSGQKLVNSIWAENNRETLLIEQSIAAQVYGGCVFRLKHDHTKRHGIGIEYLSPYFFRPIWHPSDFHQLLEVRIEFQISGQQAKLLYGDEYESDNRVRYRETWTREYQTITLDGKPLVWNNISYEKRENPYGVIPFVYVPRLRMEQFYGMSICEDLMGIQDEFNDRVADVGDQILNECHTLLALVNFHGNLETLKPTPSGILNLGTTRAGYGEPSLNRIPAGDIPRGAKDHINFLLDTAKMVGFTPPVAFGQDEGSQRSGVTLIIRMWPLLSMAKWSRAWWDDGFRDVNNVIQAMLREHGVEEYDKRFEGHELVPQWAPIQPKDREALVQELVQLASADLQSLETMVDRLGDTQDNEDEMAKIQAWMRVKRRIESGKAETQEVGQPG